ncbi:MAG: hypothetical protein HZA46_19165 [Planctomycetales bacterium]|nr:hypothetical protein [Planctomycetales bacterium]
MPKDGVPSSQQPSHPIARRDLLKSVAIGGMVPLIVVGEAWGGDSKSGDNPIVIENRRPGTDAWQLTYMRLDRGSKHRSKLIEGYCSATSVAAGEAIDIFVSATPAAEVTIDVFRMGWYSGKGGRFVTRLGPFPVDTQPTPEIGSNRVRECGWKKTTSLTIPADWLSGVYLGKLSSGAHRYQSYVVFIVRDDRQADVLFQCSDNTWQAYNKWPDEFSLYDTGPVSADAVGSLKKDGKPGDGAAPSPPAPLHRKGEGGGTVPNYALSGTTRVSFDRPYGKYPQVVDQPLSLGSGEFLCWEFPLCFWLEQHGFDVTYSSNIDTHARPELLKRGRVFLSVGHDEYWSPEMYRNMKRAIDAGLSVGFLSGNTCCFVAPLVASSDGRAHRVFHRGGRYGGLLDAEKPIMGPFDVEGPNENLLIGARTVSPFNGSGDWVVTKADHWLFEGTEMKNGDAIPGLVGWEFHGDPAKIPGLEVVASAETTNSGDKSAIFTATTYPGPKGNWVFNASTIFWSLGLAMPPGVVPPHSHFGRPHGPDPRVQRITANFLKKCGVAGV